ncbi:MAG: hypothetical protein DRJ01_16350, partial [Bacteroidetes bacterium]
MNKTNEQLSFELNDLRKKSKEREKILKAANQQLLATEQQLRATNQQLEANNQQLIATEQQLRASEDRLSKTLIAANDGMWDWNLTTNIVYFDPRYYLMAGYAIDEFPHEFDEFKKRIHPDDVENVMTHAQQHLAGKTDRFRVEFRFKKKNGDWLWVLGRGLIVERNKNNKPLRFIGTHSDITERKQVEEELQESEKQLQTLINNMPDFVCFKDKDGRWLMVNESAIRIFQLEETDYRGKKDSELAELNKKLRGSFLTCKESDARVWNNGDIIHTEETIPGTDGADRIYDVTKVPVFHAGNERKGLIIIGHDITERKQAEEELKESEEKFRLLFSEMTEGVYLHEIIYNKKGKAIDYRIIETNPASEKYLHIKPEDAIGKLATDLYGTNEAPFLDIYARVAETCKGVEFEEYFPPMKKYFHISVYCPEKGKFATIFTDITERKQAEEEIKKSEEKYHLLTETAKDFIILHDMNGQILFANTATLEQTGYSYEEFVKMSIQDFVTKDNMKQIFRN